jgi:hypothetical protein
MESASRIFVAIMCADSDSGQCNVARLEQACLICESIHLERLSEELWLRYTESKWRPARDMAWSIFAFAVAQNLEAHEQGGGT